jgi:hypothetical protein
VAKCNPADDTKLFITHLPPVIDIYFSRWLCGGKAFVKVGKGEVGALGEALRSEFKPFLKVIPDMKEKLDGTFEQVCAHSEDLAVLKIAVKNNAGRIEVNRVLISRVLEELKSKIDREEFDVLEKKVASLVR